MGGGGHDRRVGGEELFGELCSVRGLGGWGVCGCVWGGGGGRGALGGV